MSPVLVPRSPGARGRRLYPCDGVDVNGSDRMVPPTYGTLAAARATSVSDAARLRVASGCPVTVICTWFPGAAPAWTPLRLCHPCPPNRRDPYSHPRHPGLPPIHPAPI